MISNIAAFGYYPTNLLKNKTMEIHGIENMSQSQINYEIQRGGKFVIFEYCISLLIITLKRPSAIHFIRPGEGTFGKSYTYTILSAIAGWWGFPWGPIYTIMSLVTNLGGGKDVTNEVMNAIMSNQTNNRVMPNGSRPPIRITS